MGEFVRVSIGVFIGFVIVALVMGPKPDLSGEPVSISKISNSEDKITVTERLSPRNLAIVKIGDGGEKIFFDLPIGIEKGEVFTIKNGQVYKLVEIKK